MAATDDTVPLTANGSHTDDSQAKHSKPKAKSSKKGWVSALLSPRKAWRKTASNLRKLRREFVEFLLDLWHFLTRGLLMFAFEKTLPFTSRYFCRPPKPPIVSVKDVRANRIRLEIKSSFASPFNIETFEVEWTPAEADDWKSIGINELQNRTVARLKPDAEYRFRVRANNKLGVSGWCGELRARTKIDPLNGGGHAKGYTWEQTPTDVTLMFEMPAGASKKDIRLELRPEWIKVSVARPDGSTTVLLEGDLYGRVKSFEHGSFWELVKEGSKLMLNLTLEKVTKSLAPKFDYWRAIIPGDHEIDTHKITSEEAGTGLQMLQPGQYDPMQLRNMGVKGF